MKAALAAWGSDINLFHKGFAREVADPGIVAATLAKPGTILKRPVGTNEPFREQAHLPTSAQLSGRPAKLSSASKPRKSASARTTAARPDTRS